MIPIHFLSNGCDFFLKTDTAATFQVVFSFEQFFKMQITLINSLRFILTVGIAKFRLLKKPVMKNSPYFLCETSFHCKIKHFWYSVITLCKYEQCFVWLVRTKPTIFLEAFTLKTDKKHSVHFGNNKLKKIPRTAKIGRGLNPQDLNLAVRRLFVNAI